MLPYTPLHYLLMDQGFDALVMTSGNLSDEPICIGNGEAVARIGADGPLGPVCDLMLLHDRPIHLRADDSVARVAGGALRLVRRSRGYAPSPLFLAKNLVPDGCPPILAVGAHAEEHPVPAAGQGGLPQPACGRPRRRGDPALFRADRGPPGHDPGLQPPNHRRRPAPGLPEHPLGPGQGTAPDPCPAPPTPTRRR